MNKARMAFLVFAASLFLLPHTTTKCADAIEVGVAKTDITPSSPMKLWGYASRTDPFHGAQDPLHCRAIVFKDGEKSAAIVSLDLGRTPPGHWVRTIRDHAKEYLGIDQLLISATHTHAAPRLGLEDQPDPWNQTIARQVYGAIKQAGGQMQTASFSHGSGEIDITYDRRVVNDDESITMLWQNHERKATKPVDQRIQVVHIQNEHGESIATLVHYACHPVMTGNKNMMVSADAPGVVCGHVSRQVGGECIFLQGACGDINPYLAGYVQEDKTRFEAMIEESEMVGKEVVSIVAQAKPVATDQCAIQFQDQITSFGLRHPIGDERMQDYLKGHFSEAGYERFIESDRTLDGVVSILTLGNKLAWVGFPGEYFNEFQIDLDRRSPMEHTFFVGYCNGYLSYFPTIEAAAEGGYGASWGLMAEAGAGERMVDRAVIGLYELLGKF